MTSSPYRWLALLVASVLALSACQATAAVDVASSDEQADRVNTDQGDVDTDQSDTDQANTDEAESEPDAEPVATPEQDAGQDQPADQRDTEDQADEDPLFELRGELPLTNANVNSLIRFIEDDTGRNFLRPPVIVAQSSEEFALSLAEDVVDFEDDAEITVRSLQSLGLTTDGVTEVQRSFTDLLTSPDGILGYYDPEPDELYVPVGATADDDLRSLLVHELVHALDSQHVDLGVLDELVDQAELDGDWEPVIGLQAVAEGRATSVQNRWMAQNDVTQTVPDDLGALADVPPAMVLSLSIPYGFGEQYIEAQGGAAETWGLLETPPESSEEFMVFGGIPANEAVVDVPTPQADGPILDETVFGAADLFIWLLGENLEPTPELIFPTFTAIDGWAGGSSVLWGDDTQSCTRIALAGDSTQDLNEIRDAIDLWVQAAPNRSVESDGNLTTVTGCAPFVP